MQVFEAGPAMLDVMYLLFHLPHLVQSHLKIDGNNTSKIAHLCCGKTQSVRFMHRFKHVVTSLTVESSSNSTGLAVFFKIFVPNR